jgi:hypothetical protein
MSTEIACLHEFKKQLLIFFDELIEQFTQEGDLVVLRLFIDNQIPIKELIDTFIQNLNKNDQQIRKLIKNRNDNFFLNNHNMFPIIKKQKFNHFKKLWLSDILHKEDKKVIWQWLETFVFLSDRYVNVLKDAK